LGLEVIGAANGAEVIKLYEKHQPQIILLDIHMPEIDGVQAYKILRERGCQLPIIALTANAMSHEIEQYLALGFDGHLKKPIERPAFIATIAKYCKSHDAEAEQVADEALVDVDMSDLVFEFKSTLSIEKQHFIAFEKNQDWENLGRQAHRLAGAAQIFGFTQLADKACQLETSIKNNDLEHSNLATQELLLALEQTLACE
jgi:CheY-like chemotaxis protein/HPt (histidine-containing phosphotransfer) domain-containing protein